MIWLQWVAGLCAANSHQNRHAWATHRIKANEQCKMNGSFKTYNHPSSSTNTLLFDLEIMIIIYVFIH